MEMENLENKSNEVKNDIPKTNKFKSESIFFVFLAIFSIYILLNYYCFNIILTPIKVIGISMQPTINASVNGDTDTTHCDIVYYKNQESYNHSDIVIISNETQNLLSDEDCTFLIKRIIACPGDTITFVPQNSVQHINEKIYFKISVKNSQNEIILSEESYIKENMCYVNNINYYNNYPYTSSTTFASIYDALKNNNSYSISLNENEYFVMGDNRNNSIDSRIFGAVNISDIVGVVKLQIDYGESNFETLKNKFKLIFEGNL